MNEFSIYLLAQFVSVSFLFILVITNTWKKSLSTTLSVIAFLLFMYLIQAGRLDLALYQWLAILLCLVTKAVFLKEDDVVFKKGIDAFYKFQN